MDPIWSNLFKRREDPEDSVYETINRVPIFQDLSLRELRKLQAILYRRRYNSGEVIVREGEMGAGMFVILSGRVRVSHQTEDGGEQLLADLQPGDFFGEQALLDQTPRTATAVATDNCELVGFFRPDLLNLIEKNPRRGLHIVMRLSQIISVRLRHTNRLLKEARLRVRKLESEQEQSAGLDQTGPE